MMSRPIRRLVWLLPAPVRVAHTATTGFGLRSIVAPRAQQPEIGSRGEDDRGAVHDLDV